MRLFKTSQNNVLIAVRGDEKGVVITKNGKYDADLYTKARMIINDKPIDFEIKCDTVFELCKEECIVDFFLLKSCLESTEAARTCDKNDKVEKLIQ